MIKLYCNKNHGTKKGNLCYKCELLLDYTHLRIDKCPFLPDKPTCKNCTIHCYTKNYKEDIKKVMKYSGPRMMKTFPILTIHHLIDGILDKKRIENFNQRTQGNKK